jgi:hypothetical protein
MNKIYLFFYLKAKLKFENNEWSDSKSRDVLGTIYDLIKDKDISL